MTFKIKRVSATNNIPTWSLVSEGINENENILESLKREFKEEISLDPSMVDFQKINIGETDNHVFTFEEFIPILVHENLNFENLNFDWFDC